MGVAAAVMVRPGRVRRLRIRRAIRASTVAVMVVSAALTYLALEKTVTLVVDGRPQAVQTFSGDVGDLLEGHGVSLDGDDEVQPPPWTTLSDGMTVVVSREASTAFQLPQSVGVWAMEGVSGSSLSAAILHTESLLSADGPVGRSRVMVARVVVMGKEHGVLTNATTVRELLSAMGITPDRNDRVLPSPKTPLHADTVVRFMDVRVRIRRSASPIPFTTDTSYTDDLAPGTVRIVREGVRGRMLERYRVRLVDGKVVRRHLLSRRVVREPVPQMRLVGAAPTSGGVAYGEASWYSFAPGSGYTAAHPWLPFGTAVTVTNLANGDSVTVVINDRGPFGGRIIDLSPEAFSAIAPLSQGVAGVRLSW